MPSNMWDEIAYSFPNFNGTAVKVWERISNLIFITDVITYIHNEMIAIISFLLLLLLSLSS